MTQELRWLGYYQIEEEIGRGGMAIVYRAIDTRDGRVVAVKVLPQYFAHDPVFLKRFLKEGRNAVGLRHPNIVQTYEAGESDGYHYIVLEYIAGESLSDYLKKLDGPMDLTEAIEMIRQISVALNYAHQRGYIHRDIKSSNILLSQDGRVMLTDFGIAKQIAMEETMITERGGTIGTPAYMSPEQARGERGLGPESDIYSLGVLAYRMLTGRLPYEAESSWLILNKIVQESPLPANEANRDLPLGVAYALMKALAKDPKQRFHTPIEFAKALQKGLTTAPSTEEYNRILRCTQAVSQDVIAPTSPTSPPEQERSRKWLLPAVVITFFLVGIAGAYIVLPWQNRMGNDSQSGLADAANVATATHTPSPSFTPTPLPTLIHTPTIHPIPPPTQVAIATPLATTTISQVILAPYEGENGVYKLLIPADWAAARQGKDVLFTSADQYERIQLRHLQGVSPEETAETLVDDLLQDAEGTFQNIEVGKKESFTLNGQPAIRQSVQAEFLGIRFFADLMAVRIGDDAFLIFMVAPIASEQSFRPIFDTIADSFTADESLMRVAEKGEGKIDGGNTLPTLVSHQVESTPTHIPTKSKPTPKLTQPPQPAKSNDPTLVLDFESEQRWIIGDQKYGYAIGSSEQVAEGKKSLMVKYENLPGVQATGEHFIVLKRPRAASIPGKPSALQAKVFGNKDNIFLNLWIRDAKGEVWQFTFGQINHAGWQTMVLPLDVNDDWPVGVVQNKGNGKLDYPLALLGLVVDNTQGRAISDTIYLDDLRTVDLEPGTAIAAKTPAPSSTAVPENPAAPAVSPTPEHPVRNVTLAGHIAYAIWDPGQKEYLLQLRNADGSAPHTIYAGAAQPDFCLRPAGRLVANGTRSGVEGTIVIEGGESREVIPNTHDTLPACSPEGQRIVFEGDREGGPHIWIHPDINVRDDAVAHRFALGEYPSWSSKWQIIWKGCDYWASGGGKCGIWQAPDGWGSPVRLSTGGSDTAPDVSPDGGMVAFMSHETGKWQVFVVPAWGGQPQQLTTEGDNGLPTWSPDGSGIAFVSNRNGGWGLWVMNADGANQQKVATLEAGFGGGPIDWTRQRISWGP